MVICYEKHARQVMKLQNPIHPSNTAKSNSRLVLFLSFSTLLLSLLSARFLHLFTLETPGYDIQRQLQGEWVEEKCQKSQVLVEAFWVFSRQPSSVASEFVVLVPTCSGSVCFGVGKWVGRE